MMSQKVEVQMIEKSGRKGNLYYKVTHNRKSCLIETGHIIDVSEWDYENGMIKVESDKTYANWLKLCLIRKSVQSGLQILEQVIEDLRKRGRFTSGDIVEKYKYTQQTLSYFRFMEGVIAQLGISGRTRTSETYMSAYKRFRLFVGTPDITFNEMDSELIEMYEDYLKKSHISLNTISFYMRIMRAVYNRGVESGLVLQHYPFRRVYTGVEKTVKRAIPFTFIKSIKQLKLKEHSALEWARDLFLFSFYTRGMSFVDMAYLKTSDIFGICLPFRPAPPVSRPPSPPVRAVPRGTSPCRDGYRRGRFRPSPPYPWAVPFLRVLRITPHWHIALATLVCLVPVVPPGKVAVRGLP